MRRLILTAGLLAAVASPAFAQSAAVKQDVRCVIVMNLMAREEKLKSFAGMGLVYYVGRLDGRGLGAQLQTLLQTEAKGLTQPQAQSEAKRCASEFQARGEQMRTMGGPPAGQGGATGAAPPPKS